MNKHFQQRLALDQQYVRSPTNQRVQAALANFEIHVNPSESLTIMELLQDILSHFYVHLAVMSVCGRCSRAYLDPRRVMWRITILVRAAEDDLFKPTEAFSLG